MTDTQITTDISTPMVQATDVLAIVATQLHERINTIDLQMASLQAERIRITRALNTLASDVDLAADWKPKATPAAPAATSTTDTLTEVKPRTLRDAINQVLAGSTEPMKAAQIAERVLARGWRSHSSNFRQVIYVALSKYFTRADGNTWTASNGTSTSSTRGGKRSKRGAR